ncbi:MAG: DUF2267 domain-containing protein [Acetobacteraceae bacterium]|nr:DUF2267 domain-containing protein [Acetobacteraceae bacterium]
MSATGLEVFDKTLQITNTWLEELMTEIGPQRQVAWHALSAVLQVVRDRLPIELSAHLAAQLPLLVRGAYFDQWRPEKQPDIFRTEQEFQARVEAKLTGTRPVNVREVARAIFGVLDRHVTPGQIEKVREALPEHVRALWPAPGQFQPAATGSLGGGGELSMGRRE